MSKEIRCFDLEGNFLQDFKTIKEAAEFLKVPHQNISRCLDSGVLYVKSYQFREIVPDLLGTLGDVSESCGRGGINIPIGKYWNGRLISVYNSQHEAAFKNKLNQGTISRAISRNYKVNGFEFKEIK